MSFVPPNFSDIGKSANDLLGKDYPVGSAKLEVNTTTPNGIKFTVTGNKDNKSGLIGSDLKAKYVDKPRGSANKLSLFTASYHHRVNNEVEAAAKATWNKATDSSVAIEVGTKYALDRDAFLKAKVDNTGRLGLGYTQVLRPGIKLALGGLFDTTRLQADVHKVGFSLTFEA
ncbi:Mitochondrial porin [Batrachochytrium dendrobatidis]|nr:Mitochondrial porin [Batrachochytrium dendrobatidis]